jgi:hypothetical protein
LQEVEVGEVDKRLRDHGKIMVRVKGRTDYTVFVTKPERK